MTRAPQPTSSILNAPPDLPSDPKIDTVLTNYLRSFALWARRSLAMKMNAYQAQPSLLLLAYDAAPGTTPAVWKVQVNMAGVLSTVRVPLGGDNPEAPSVE